MNFAVDSQAMAYIAYAQPSDGAGYESRVLTMKWGEAVLMHWNLLAQSPVTPRELDWCVPSAPRVPVSFSDAREIEWALDPDEMKF